MNNTKRITFAFAHYYNFFGSKTLPLFMQPQYLHKSDKLFAKYEIETMLEDKDIIPFYQQDESQRKQFVVFGRSNVGKSSLINAILKDNIAEVSKTPGKTQKLCSYRLANNTYLIDAPGFGFTSGVEKKKVDSWKRLVQLYLKHGCCSKALCLIDAQHGFKQTDLSLFRYLNSLNKPFVIVFTKIDKKAVNEQSFVSFNDKFSYLHPTIHYTSANKLIGIQELKRDIACLIDQPSAF